MGFCNMLLDDFSRAVSQRDAQFDRLGAWSFQDDEGSFIGLEKNSDETSLFLTYTYTQKKFFMIDIFSVMKRGNIRTNPPFLFSVIWPEDELTPRFIIRFDDSDSSVDVAYIFRALDFLKRIAKN